MSKKVIKRNNRNFIPTAENTYTTKKVVETKWSFWVVLALVVFCKAYESRYKRNYKA